MIVRRRLDLFLADLDELPLGLDQSQKVNLVGRLAGLGRFGVQLDIGIELLARQFDRRLFVPYSSPSGGQVGTPLDGQPPERFRGRERLDVVRHWSGI